MRDLYNNIKRFRIDNGLTQEELARATGYADKGMISRIESGKIDLPISKVKIFADALSVEPADLMGDDWVNDILDNARSDVAEAFNGDPFLIAKFQESEAEGVRETASAYNANLHRYPLSDKEYTHITKYRQLEPYSKDTVDYIIDRELERLDSTHSVEEPPIEYNDDTKIIPFYPQLVSAGTGQYVFDDIPTETIAVDNKKFRRATYAIRVRGNSMEPTFYDNDIIIVDRDAVPDINEIGIFIIDNQGYVKRVGDKALISDNKAYASIESDDIVCMGKVLGKI